MIRLKKWNGTAKRLCAGDKNNARMIEQVEDEWWEDYKQNKEDANISR